MDRCSKAARLTVGPELFFPIGNTGPAIRQVAEAKAMCRECEVVGVYPQWAISNNQDSGVWGGMSEEERCPLRHRAVHARHAGYQQATVPARAAQMIKAEDS